RTRLAYWSTAMVLTGGVIVGLAAWSQGMREPGRAVLLVGASALGLAVLLARSQSRRGTWGATCAVGFLVLLAGIPDLLPEYAGRFSLRHPVQMHAWNAKDTDAPVVCYPHRFESVGFYTGRTGVREFGRGNRAAMVSSLQANPKSLVFVQSRFLQELL